MEIDIIKKKNLIRKRLNGNSSLQSMIAGIIRLDSKQSGCVSYISKQIQFYTVILYISILILYIILYLFALYINLLFLSRRWAREQVKGLTSLTRIQRIFG